MKTRLDTSIECVLFDLDGTLIDTAPDFVLALNQLLSEESRPSIDAERIGRTVSDGARALVRLGFDEDEDSDRFQALLQRLLDLYLAQLSQTKAKLYPGLAELLDELGHSSIPWGIVTNKPRLYAEALLTQMNLLKHCPVLVCPDDVQAKKPNPESLLLALEKLDCGTERCVYLGDHLRDMQAAKNADVIAIAATYGYLDHETDPTQWPADFILKQPEQAIDLLHLLKFS